MTPEQRRERYRHGGQVSPGNFKHDPDRAVEAGRQGGFASNFRNRPGAAKAAIEARWAKAGKR